jgi:hypothetical protein
MSQIPTLLERLTNLFSAQKSPGEADRAGREAGSAAEEAAEGSDQAGVLQVQHGGEALPGSQQAGLPISPIENVVSTTFFFR